jgi:hypothetical protein
MPAAMTFVTGSAAEIVVASVVEAGSGFDDCISIGCRTSYGRRGGEGIFLL